MTETPTHQKVKTSPLVRPGARFAAKGKIDKHQSFFKHMILLIGSEWDSSLILMLTDLYVRIQDGCFIINI